MTNKDIQPTVDERAADVRATLQEMWQQYVTESIELLRQAFPEIVADAEQFVLSTNSQPWEFAVAMIGGQEGEIRDKYRVPPGRHRPPSQSVPAATDMFCAACELIEEREFLHPDRQL